MPALDTSASETCWQETAGREPLTYATSAKRSRCSKFSTIALLGMMQGRASNVGLPETSCAVGREESTSTAAAGGICGREVTGG
jgi:hypothetical protein